MRRASSIKQLLRVSLGTAVLATAMSATWANAALVGYWKLNEAMGTIAPDSSGNNRHGTLVGALAGPPADPGPAWVPAGVFDGAIGLDGLNDRIHVPYHVDFTYTGGDNMTLSTWVYLNAGETTGRIISKPWHGSGQYNYVLMVSGTTNTTVTFSLANPAMPPVGEEPNRRQSVTLTSPSYPSFREEWHHIAAVADSDNNMAIYVNGTLAATRTSTITDWDGTNQSIPLVLGSLYPYGSTWAGNTDFSLDGKLDDVAIWKEALAPARIMSIYNVPTTLGLSYNLGDMMTLWAAYDAGPGGAGAVNRTPWQYTDELPGSPPALGGAYTHGDAMYIVLGSDDGLRSPAITNWVGGGADGHWSTAANWNPQTNDPYGYVLYYDHGVAVDIAKLNATIDDSYTVAGMRLNNLSAEYETVDPNGDRHYMFEVPPGTTLTVSGAVDIGFRNVVSPANSPPNLRNRYSVTGEFTGGGEMVINGPVTIRNTGCSWGSPAVTAPATLDVSGLSRFTVDTTGDIQLGGQNVGWGELILSPDNLLRAANILVPGLASSTSVTPTSRIHLGQQNTLHANTIFIGGRGLNGAMFFQDGLDNPTVIIRDRAGTGPVDLTIGDMVANARTISGTVDFTGGTVDAQIAQLQLGIVHVGTSEAQQNSPHGATGTLSMSAGTISANHVLLGQTKNGVNPNRLWAEGFLNIQGGKFTAGSVILGQDDAGTNRARGAINFTGGTLSAGTIQKGVGGGEAIFNFTGGTLHVGTFGSEDKPIDLDQIGGTLAPGNSIGTTTIYGDYDQAAGGILQIEIAGTETAGTDFDFVEVVGNTLLEGWLEVLLIPDFTAKPGDVFDVLHTSGTLDIAGDLSTRLIGDLPSPTFGWWEVATVLGTGGEGMTLRLAAVPEPSALLLVAFGLISLVLAGGRRSGKRAGQE